MKTSNSVLGLAGLYSVSALGLAGSLANCIKSNNLSTIPLLPVVSSSAIRLMLIYWSALPVL